MHLRLMSDPAQFPRKSGYSRGDFYSQVPEYIKHKYKTQGSILCVWLLHLD